MTVRPAAFGPRTDRFITQSHVPRAPELSPVSGRGFGRMFEENSTRRLEPLAPLCILPDPWDCFCSLQSKK